MPGSVIGNTQDSGSCFLGSSPSRAALNHVGFSAINPMWFMANSTLDIDMYYVYVLLSSQDKKFYIGFSEDVKKRLADHNAGRNTSTKPRRPFELIYYEAHLSKEDALRREAYFKTTKGKSTLRQIRKSRLSFV